MEHRGVVARLDAIRDQLTPQERGIVDCILSDLDGVAGKSIHDMAAASSVSVATISRFCKKIGFSGYREFQSALTYEAGGRVAPVVIPTSQVLSEISPHEDISRLIRKVTRKNAQALCVMEALIDPHAIERAVELLARARSVTVFAHGSSLIVAHDLVLKLMRAGLSCSLLDDGHAQHLAAANLRASDVAVAISYTGTTPRVLECARLASEGGAAVIAITRGASTSGLRKIADVTIPVPSTGLAEHGTDTMSRIAEMHAVDLLFASYVTTYYERCVPFIRRDLE